MLDTETGNLIYILRTVDGLSQLAITVDYRQRVQRQLLVSNAVVSAYHPSIPTLLGRIAVGALVYLTGLLG